MSSIREQVQRTGLKRNCRLVAVHGCRWYCEAGAVVDGDLGQVGTAHCLKSQLDGFDRWCRLHGVEVENEGK